MFRCKIFGNLEAIRMIGVEYFSTVCTALVSKLVGCATRKYGKIAYEVNTQKPAAEAPSITFWNVTTSPALPLGV